MWVVEKDKMTLSHKNGFKIILYIWLKMRKHLFTFLLLIAATLMWNPPAFAQQKKAVKMNSSFSKNSIDSNQDVPELLREARSIRTSQPAKALDIIKDALAISISNNNHRYQAECYLLIASINESIQEWELAIDNYNLTEEQLRQTGKGWQESKMYFELLYGRGNSYIQLANYDEALTDFTTIHRIRRDKFEHLDAYLKLAEIDLIRRREKGFHSTIKTSEQLSQELKGYKSGEIADLKKQWANQVKLGRKDSTNITQNGITSPSSGNITTDDKIDLSNYYLENRQPNRAIQEIEKAEKEILKSDKSEKKILLYETKAKIYDQIGNEKKAIEAYQQLDSERIKQSKEEELFLNKKTEILKKQRTISSVSKDFELDEKQEEIEQKEEEIQSETLKNQRLVIYGLLFIVMLLCIGTYLILKNARKSKIANQLLALKSLRSQMNPHFIFNALNSVNHFVAKNDERAANKFLAEFSRLMRLVLEHSQEDFISLETEKEILSLYIKLEHYRFRDKFEYQFIIDESIDLDSTQIPPMLLQPYIENAIWHGLRYKETKGMLIVNIRQENKTIIVTISDDGIGRTASKKEKTKHQKQHKSVGLKNIEERLAILNKVYKLNYTTTLSDLNPANHSGTLVEIKLSKKN